MRVAAVSILTTVLAACSGGGSNGGTTTTGTTTSSGGESCIPGQSIACVGPGGCAGGQACAADGKSYDACQCGASTTGAASTGSAASSASSSSSSTGSVTAAGSSGGGTGGTAGSTGGSTGATTATATNGTSSGSTGGGTSGGSSGSTSTGGTSGGSTGGSTGSGPTTLAVGTANVGSPGSLASAGLACDFTLTVASAGLPSSPNPTGTVAASAVLSAGCGLPSPMTGTYDTGTGQLIVTALDGQGVNHGLVGNTTGEEISGLIESSANGGGEFAALFVPPGGSVLAFCGSVSSGTEGLDPLVSSDGTVVALDFSNGNTLNFDSGTAADGGVALMLTSGPATFTIVQGAGGASLSGDGYQPASSSANGC